MATYISARSGARLYTCMVDRPARKLKGSPTGFSAHTIISKMAQRMDLTDNFSQASAVPSDTKCEPTAKPTCIVCLGMAGSGKTTFMQVSVLYLLIVGL